MSNKVQFHHQATATKNKCIDIDQVYIKVINSRILRSNGQNMYELSIIFLPDYDFIWKCSVAFEVNQYELRYLSDQLLLHEYTNHWFLCFSWFHGFTWVCFRPWSDVHNCIIRSLFSVLWSNYSWQTMLWSHSSVL